MDQQILILRLVHPKRRAPSSSSSSTKVVQPLHLAVQSSTDTTTSDESEESTEAGDTPIDSNDPANAADGSRTIKKLLFRKEPFDAFLDKRFGKDSQSFKPANPYDYSSIC